MSDRPIRVLLVDDDEDYYVLTRDLLREVRGQRYALRWVARYQQALAALAAGDFDVALLDYHLGEHTGLELLTAALASGCRQPLIMLTGQPEHAVDVNAMHAGAADYLSKGKVDAAQLERAIRYALERARTLAALADREARLREHAEALERAYAELRALEQLRDDLVHMIVHDLRSPLSALLLNLDLVAKTWRDPQHADAVPRFLGSARGAVQRLMVMIDDLLHVSKLEAGELRPALAPLDLRALLGERVAAWQAQGAGDGKTFTLEVAPDVPRVPADPALLARVIDNLLSNAVKYTMAGGHITVAAVRSDGYVAVRVCDDGEGIPPQYLDRVFDKFMQVTDPRGVPLRKGTGLGLAFCRLAVEAHGGTIGAESVLGEGSTFTFTLPLAPAS